MAKELDVGMKCIKYMLFITNFMFVMIGFLLISIGGTITCIYNDFEMFMEAHYFSPAALFVAIGIIIFFVALLGCVGAIKESTCLVNLYSFMLFLILVLEVSAVIAAFAMRGRIRVFVEEKMWDTKQYYAQDEYIRESWDMLQGRLQCCGVHGSADWEGVLIGSLPLSPVNPLENSNNNDTLPPPVPDSCVAEDGFIFNRGCLDRLYYIISECALLLGTGGICVAIVQALGVIFANLLAKSIRRIKTEEEQKRQENRLRLYAQLARGNDEKPTPVIYTAGESEA